MEFDYEYPIMVGGIITYPGYAFVALPVQPTAIEETSFIQGSTGGVAIGIGGSVDSNKLRGGDPISWQWVYLSSLW